MTNINSYVIPWLVFYVNFENYVQGTDQEYKGLIYYYSTLKTELENSPFEFVKTDIPNLYTMNGDTECDAQRNFEYELGNCLSNKNLTIFF